MELARPVDGELRQRLQTLPVDVHAALAPEPVPRDREGDHVRAGGPARERRAAARVADELGDPPEDDAVELRSRMAERPQPRVLVERDRPGLGESRGGQDAARDVAEVAAARRTDDA